MKRLAVVACAGLIAVACGSKSTPTQPSNPNVLTFTASLSAANEVPPITNAEANARGDATVTMNVTRDAAGNITGGNMSWTFNVSGFPANTNLILNHIHEAGPGVNGSVVINSGLSAGSPLVLANGTITNQTYSNLLPVVGGNTDFTVFQRLAANPNGFYFNIHTPLNGGGAVRGQLVKQP